MTIRDAERASRIEALRLLEESASSLLAVGARARWRSTTTAGGSSRGARARGDGRRSERCSEPGTRARAPMPRRSGSRTPRSRTRRAVGWRSGTPPAGERSATLSTRSAALGPTSRRASRAPASLRIHPNTRAGGQQAPTLSSSSTSRPSCSSARDQSTGARTSARVPAPAVDSTESPPPTLSRRARCEERPMWPRASRSSSTVSSKPRPSSRIAITM